MGVAIQRRQRAEESGRRRPPRKGFPAENPSPCAEFEPRAIGVGARTVQGNGDLLAPGPGTEAVAGSLVRRKLLGLREGRRRTTGT